MSTSTSRPPRRPTETVMPWGSHKGIPIGQLPDDYLAWVGSCRDKQGRPTWPRAVAIAVEAELARRNGNGHDKPKPSEEPVRDVGRYAYDRYLRKRMAGGGWFALFRDDLRLGILSPAEAVLVNQLVNSGKSLADQDGWIRAAPSWVESCTGLGEDEQERLFDALAARKIVQVEGEGRARRVRVRVRRLLRLLEREGNGC